MTTKRDIGRRQRRNYTKASPVKITKADGTVEEQPAYSRAAADRVIEKGNRQAQTWSESEGGSAGRLKERNQRMMRSRV